METLGIGTSGMESTGIGVGTSGMESIGIGVGTSGMESIGIGVGWATSCMQTKGSSMGIGVGPTLEGEELNDEDDCASMHPQTLTFKHHPFIGKMEVCRENPDTNFEISFSVPHVFRETFENLKRGLGQSTP